jgi:hypothetical protein
MDVGLKHYDRHEGKCAAVSLMTQNHANFHTANLSTGAKNAPAHAVDEAGCSKCHVQVQGSHLHPLVKIAAITPCMSRDLHKPAERTQERRRAGRREE